MDDSYVKFAATDLPTSTRGPFKRSVLSVQAFRWAHIQAVMKVSRQIFKISPIAMGLSVSVSVCVYLRVCLLLSFAQVVP